MGGDSVRVICGPTAAGKSSLALALAERFHGAIISADSRQVYCGFDIGTAKPTTAERASVPHFGIDVADPESRYSAAAWSAAAAGWIERSRADGRVPLIVGGTGFYLRALFEPLFEAPAMDDDRRRALAGALDGMSLAELRRWCERLDPERAHLGRAQLLRAVETALLTGQRLSALHRARARAPRYTARYLVVDPGTALTGRIHRRVEAMFDGGWRDEVRVLEHRVSAGAPAWNATGYGVVRRLVSGEIAEAAARDAILIETRQYAKRQRTWFRHQLDDGGVTRIDPEDPASFEQATAWWDAEGGA